METTNDTLDQSSGYIDQRNVSPWKTAAKWGLIAGMAMVIYLLIEEIAVIRSQWLSFLAIVVILGVTIGLAMKKHRDEELGGFLTYGRGLGVGMIVALVVGVLAGIFLLIYSGLIDPGIIEERLAAQEEMLYEQGQLSDEEIEETMMRFEQFTTPFTIALGMVFNVGLVGLIVSLIEAAIFQKKPYQA